MKLIPLQQQLQHFNSQGVNAFSTKMLASYFPQEQAPAFRKTLASAVSHGVLERVCRGVYVYPIGFSQEIYQLEKIAVILRMGCYSYVSLESALAEYGVISQLPLNRITVMTTGRKQTYTTVYGVIEFTHTKRTERNIIEHTHKLDKRPLRIASVMTAYQDLTHVGRNLHMVNEQVYQELVNAN